jgi:hypothetical protein
MQTVKAHQQLYLACHLWAVLRLESLAARASGAMRSGKQLCEKIDASFCFNEKLPQKTALPKSTPHPAVASMLGIV